ncbi:carbohydrate ABC transporter permease [Spiroplasma clarkii]|nr:sugar ABC transporter permease [Spiroplasma clarkii]
MFETNVSNFRDSLPIERGSLIKNLSITLGIIPGVCQFINKQYIKGSLLFFVGLPIAIILLLYSFGIGNVGGNGIFGLIDFGKSAETTDNFFDIDGRFYFVESILGMLLLFIVIAFFAINYYNSWITTKQIKIGGRPSLWMNTRKYLQSQGVPYVLTLPSLIGILLIVVFPVVATFVIAFTDYGKGSDPANPGQYISWIGFDNFKKIFGGQYGSSFVFVFQWTIIWVIFAGFGGIVVGTIFCLLINNERMYGKKIFRLIMILPGAVPGFVMVLLFSILFSSQTFNNFTNKIFGVYGWTTELALARIALIFVNAWLSQTYIFLLFTGVSQGISKDLYDSSKIDGASKPSQTFKITLPILFSQTGPLLIGQFTGAFSNFGIIALFNSNGSVLSSNGELMAGNPGITDILISFVYKITNDQQNYSYGLGAAFIIIFSLFTVSMAFMGMRNMKAFKKGVV